MVPIAEIIFVLVVMALGTRWYLRTPLHRARKSSGVFPPQVHGHMGFGMYTPSNPPRCPMRCTTSATRPRTSRKPTQTGPPDRATHDVGAGSVWVGRDNDLLGGPAASASAEPRPRTVQVASELPVALAARQST